MYARVYLCKHYHAHMQNHVRAHVHTSTHTHTNTRTNTHTDAHTRTPTLNIHTPTHTHTHIDSHVHAHINTQAYTCTHNPISFFPFPLLHINRDVKSGIHKMSASFLKFFYTLRTSLASTRTTWGAHDSIHVTCRG